MKTITLNLNGFTKLKINSAVVVFVKHGITTHFPIKMVSKRSMTKVKRYFL